MTNAQPKEFGKWRAFFWPIHKHELKKFIPMGFLMFFILLIYTLVRDLKDTFLQYRSHIAYGTDSTTLISALKLWFVLPCAFLAVMLFSFLIDKFDSTKTFYIIVSSFVIFYAVFGLFIYPNLESLLMPVDQLNNMLASFPLAFRTVLTCIGNWPISLFYILSEIWGTLGISSLFWQFANATTMKHEVKRFFGLFPIIGNIGSFIAAEAISRASKSLDETRVMILMGVVCLSGILVLAMYTLINKWVLKDERCFDPKLIKVKKKKGKVGIFEGIKILFTNSYMGFVSMLVIGYGMAINFSEVVMKSQMRSLCTTPGEYLHMYSTMSKVISVLTIFVTIFASNVLRRCKWKTAALVTPAIFLIAGTLFFMATLYNKFISNEIFGISALSVAVWAGMMQDAMAKSVKYTLFDTTKSMTYIPLDEDTKTKGQAAVEVVGGRAGKAGASLIQQIMYGIKEGGVMDHVVTIVVIYAVAVIGWILSVFRLSPKYEKAVKEQAEQEQAENEKIVTE